MLKTTETNTQKKVTTLIDSTMDLEFTTKNSNDTLAKMRTTLGQLKLQLQRANNVYLASKSEEAHAQVSMITAEAAVLEKTYTLLLVSLGDLHRHPHPSPPASVSTHTTSSEHSLRGISTTSDCGSLQGHPHPSTASVSPSTTRSEHSLNGTSIISNLDISHAPHLPPAPEGLPFIQWESHKFKYGEPLYEDPHICLKYFEMILRLNLIDIDAHWKRMILPQLSAVMIPWVISIPDATPWQEFKQLFFARYGPSPKQVQADAKQKLMTLRMRKGETITEYMDRFKQLSEKAGLLDSDPILHRALFHPLPSDVRHTLSIFNALSNAAPDAKLESIDKMILRVTNAYNYFEKQKWLSLIANTPSSPKPSDDRRQVRNRRKPYDRNSLSNPSSRLPKPYCTFHKMHGHHTNDCRAKDSESVKCNECGKLFTKKQTHKCKSTTNSKHDSFRKNNRTSHRPKQKNRHTNSYSLEIQLSLSMKLVASGTFL